MQYKLSSVGEIYSRVVRASDCQCRSRMRPGLDTSILRLSGIWGAADKAMLNKLHKQRGYKVENREECDTEGKQRGICIRKEKRGICIKKEKREESDTHVMDTRWRTERNVIHRENREEYVSRRRRGRKVIRTWWILGGEQRGMWYIEKTERNMYQEGEEGGKWYARDRY